MSGTLVLTAMITSVFDDLFANIYKGTDAVVRFRCSIATSVRANARTFPPRSSTW
jgi:hypothetical protein